MKDFLLLAVILIGFGFVVLIGAVTYPLLVLFIGFVVLISTVAYPLMWLFLAAYGKVAKSSTLAIALAAIVAAVLAAHPATEHVMAFIVFWAIVLWFTKVAYVNARVAFRRVGATKNRLDAAVEVFCLNYLLTLACVAIGVSVAFAALATLVVWPLANAVAKRREWPLLMRTAGR